ncbi:putative bifunctional diguanylate cyclase/phosphodiesterase [Jatrophihabitans endophyticus]|uniref:putative bifunctional diguanylate cyclase/phosphodiesterase n=1 Tax=Jatrophihabitans endophyticus TaxID=1206085 RepID=UPI001160FFCF|nr:EAL domain-containing protein [Jatrophihabitans endophyticus]
MTWRPRSGARASARGLALLPWLLLAGCPVVLGLVLLVAPGLGDTWISVSLALFFVVLSTRLVVTAVAQPDRRPTLLMLLLGLVLFATGSTVLNAGGRPDQISFPAPGEAFFLASYVAMVLYVLLDANRHAGVTRARWLEAGVICGGCACLAGSLIVGALKQQLQQDGMSLVLAVLYPLIDVGLALVVGTQIAVRQRAVRDGLVLVIAFLMLAVADVGFLFRLSSGTYGFGNASIVLWGVALALVIDNASRRRPLVEDAHRSDALSVPVSLAGMAAAFVLAFQPTGSLRMYFVVPALATLGAAGARLVIAVRGATRAGEAFRLSRSDDLTELPNRRAMLSKVEKSLRQIDRLGLMMVDLDGFKDINDTLGHAAGDAVLREIAGRIRNAVDSSALVARLGGDEFAVVVPTESEIELMECAQRINAAVRLPLVIDGISLSVGASIGITTRHATDTSSGELLRRADVAMYEAKRRRLQASVYDPEVDEFSRERLSLADELRRGIGAGQLVLWYQPQFDAVTSQPCGLEALVRWQHPTRGLLLPGLFLPVARRAGLMPALSTEIARIAVADLTAWRARGASPRLAINCAPPELMSGIFVPRLQALLQARGIPTDQIVIEITEDSFLAEPERARAHMLEISRAGFQISVDDYGTGFSSLAYLRDLPIQELKMDRSFVASAAEDARSRMIVASTLQMAAALGLRAVAEGVEDAVTARLLTKLGADVLQGFHLSRPLPPDVVMAFVAEHGDEPLRAQSRGVATT